MRTANLDGLQLRQRTDKRPTATATTDSNLDQDEVCGSSCLPIHHFDGHEQIPLPCQHPTVSATSRTLPLRVVGDITPAEIAHAHRASEQTMTARMGRAKLQTAHGGTPMRPPATGMSGPVGAGRGDLDRERVQWPAGSVASYYRHGRASVDDAVQ